MRYRVRGIEIRAENTAKPAAQASGVLKKWLRQNLPTGDVLDFGCGKLRYASILAQTATTLTLVDSAEQLRREQIIEGRRCSILNFVFAKWRRARVLTVRAFQDDHARFDFILCANVLSAIPCKRTRTKVLMLLSSRLKTTGRCLFVTQYRNSDFKNMARQTRSRAHLDGWIMVKQRSASYYGIIPMPKLISLVRANGHRVVESWVDGQSAYVLTGLGNRKFDHLETKTPVTVSRASSRGRASGRFTRSLTPSTYPRPAAPPRSAPSRKPQRPPRRSAPGSL